jgi:hypothetical protein
MKEARSEKPEKESDGEAFLGQGIRPPELGKAVEV